MKRYDKRRYSYDYMIRVGFAALCVFCVLVTLVAAFSAMRGNETYAEEEPVPVASCEDEAVVYEAEEEPEIVQETVSIPVVEKAEEVDPDTMLLAKLITCEMGCDWISAEQKYKVGSVVLNRVADSRFPDTIYDVIWQTGQYGCAMSGALVKAEPSEEIVAIAKDLVENGSRLPADVVWQAEFHQGDGVFCEYYDAVLGTTTYYCY